MKRFMIFDFQYSNGKFRSFIALSILLFLTGRAFAYDGDVDYSAPYLTVDPETGQLVTIDPKAQTKIPHGTGDDSSISISSSNPEPEASESNVTSQTATSSVVNGNNDSPDEPAGVNLPLIAGVVTGLVLISLALVMSRRKQAAAGRDNTGDQQG